MAQPALHHPFAPHNQGFHKPSGKVGRHPKAVKLESRIADYRKSVDAMRPDQRIGYHCPGSFKK